MFGDPVYGPSGYCPTCLRSKTFCVCFEIIFNSYTNEAKMEYTSVLTSGMFWEFYPELTGVWDQDKNQWQTIFEELQKTRNK